MTLLRRPRRELEFHIRMTAPRLLRRAFRGTWDGRPVLMTDPYFRSCIYEDSMSGMKIILTRDVGHHTSGWFKNPDYERCLHLSMSSWDPAHARPVGTLDDEVAGLWIEALFQGDAHLAWKEPAATPEGRSLDVVHWRLFCDERWQAILPRGEVYTLDFTEKGWKTYSQVRAETGLVVESPLNPHPE